MKKCNACNGARILLESNGRGHRKSVPCWSCSQGKTLKQIEAEKAAELERKAIKEHNRRIAFIEK